MRFSEWSRRWCWPRYRSSDGKLFTTRAGYHHLDVLTAARTQNNGKPEIVSTSLVDFVMAGLGTTG